MPLKINQATGKLDKVGNGLLVAVSRPSTPTANTLYLITGTSTIEIYYASQWQVLHTLTAPDTSWLDMDGNPLDDMDGNPLDFMT